MVTRETTQHKALFICESCGFAYPTQELAKRCEAYCREYRSCSLEITQHAVKKD